MRLRTSANIKEGLKKMSVEQEMELLHDRWGSRTMLSSVVGHHCLVSKYQVPGSLLVTSMDILSFILHNSLGGEKYCLCFPAEDKENLK